MPKKIVFFLAVLLMCWFSTQLLSMSGWLSVLKEDTPTSASEKIKADQVNEDGNADEIKLSNVPEQVDEAESNPSLVAPAIELKQTEVNINVPSDGYLIENAASYFVPKKDRRPGNLGGPPPPAISIPETETGFRPVEEN